MAVTLTTAQLAAALRLGSTPEETEQAERLLAYATEATTKYAPNAPEATHNEAVIRLAGYLFDVPAAGRGAAYANAFRNSGAASGLLPYRIHHVGSVEEAVTAAVQSGTPGNPVINVAVSGDSLVVTYSDGGTQSLTLPAGTGLPGDDVAVWAEEGNTSLIPADKLRAPTASARGAPFGVTNAIIDDDTHVATTLYAWSKSHVKRLIERLALQASVSAVPTYTPLTGVLARSSGGASFTIPSSNRTAIIAALTGSTYHSFLIEIAHGGSGGLANQEQAFLIPLRYKTYAIGTTHSWSWLHINSDFTSIVRANFEVRAPDPGNSVASLVALTKVGTSNFSSGSTAQIYGVS